MKVSRNLVTLATAIAVIINGTQVIGATLKNQSISTSIGSGSKFELTSLRISSGAVSSSGLPVSAVSRTPSTCKSSPTDLQITLISVGYCRLLFTQAGSRNFSAAQSVFVSIVIVNTDQIDLTLPDSAPLGSPKIPLISLSRLGNPVQYRIQDSSLCRIEGNYLVLIAAGLCSIEAVTSRLNSSFQIRATSVSTSIKILGINLITFTLPTTIPLSAGSVSLGGKASSGLPISYLSRTPDICQISNNMLVPLKAGACQIQADQSGNSFYPAAAPVTILTQITVMRYLTNSDDNNPGYKIQAVYVVPSDGVDHQFDTNGYIVNLLKDGESYLDQQIGRHFPLAHNSDGSISVLYLRSQYSTSYLSTYFGSIYFGSAEDVLGNLLSEIGQSRDDDVYGTTHYVFFTDVNMFGNAYCGYAPKPGNVAITAVGGPITNSGCNTPASGPVIRWHVETWIHETLHGLGIDHTPAGCDVMASPHFSCPAGYPIDSGHQYYVGSTFLSGINILDLPVWARN